MTIKHLALAAAATIIAAPAAATVVAFELPQDGGTHLSAGGLNFDDISPNQFIGEYYGSATGNHSGVYMGLGLITITRQGGGSFFLDSVDFGRGKGPSAIFFDYALTLPNGDLTGGSLPIDEAFSTVTIGQEVTSLVIASQGWIALDNLTYHDIAAPEAVPEPAMLGLFGMAAVALGLSRRRKRALSSFLKSSRPRVGERCFGPCEVRRTSMAAFHPIADIHTTSGESVHAGQFALPCQAPRAILDMRPPLGLAPTWPGAA